MHPEDRQAYLDEFLKCTQDQRPFHATVRVRRADGAWRAIESHARPRFSESGAFRGFVGASIDVTERLDAERAVRKLNRTLEGRVAERTADLEERNKELQHFAYIASHDLREPLRKIQSFGDLLQDEAKDGLSEDAGIYVQRMRSAAARMDMLLSDLLAYSRIATHIRPFAPVHLEKVISDVLDDYELKIRDLDAVVDAQVSGALDADESQLRQLVSNLVSNSLTFRRDGVRPHIRVHASIETDRARASEQDCRIVIEDNGIGFDEKYLGRIFEPFERLHGRTDYEGTGMGLAICRRIVQRHRGEITAESVPGEGSRFVVVLPVRQQEKVAPSD
jgi:light-regulated signal transduction histidine kinase (bacteriophytochrome)